MWRHDDVTTFGLFGVFLAIQDFCFWNQRETNTLGHISINKACITCNVIIFIYIYIYVCIYSALPILHVCETTKQNTHTHRGKKKNVWQGHHNSFRQLLWARRLKKKTSKRRITSKTAFATVAMTTLYMYRFSLQFLTKRSHKKHKQLFRTVTYHHRLNWYRKTSV